MSYSISRIKKSVGDNLSFAAKKSQDLVEISKLNIAISSEDEAIDELYRKIGKKIYKLYENGVKFNSDISDYCSEIKEIKKDVASLKKKITNLKDMKLCSKCGHEINKKALYCDKCGSKQ